MTQERKDRFSEPCWSLVLLVFIGMACFLSSGVWAQTDGTLTASETSERVSLWSTLVQGGIIGFFIILVSIVALSLVIQNFIILRRERILPDGLIDTLDDCIKQKQFAEAKQVCREDGSFLAHVVAAGLNQVGSMFGFYDMQNTMQETSEREISKLYGKLEYLSFIASTSPMLGLLGTVTGMITSFNQIAQTEGSASPSQLAGGISEALVTTCLGLVVAIPSMFFVAFFRRRIDSLVTEAETILDKLMRPLRQTR